MIWKLGTQCMACGKTLNPHNHLMFKMSLDGKKVKDSDLIQRGFCCKDLMCLAKATGCDEE